MMFEVISFIFMLATIILSILFYRSIGRISFYETSYDDIYSRLLMFSESLDRVLEKEIYSNDPVIVEMIGQMQDIQWFVSQLQDDYRFNSLGESTEDEAT